MMKGLSVSNVGMSLLWFSMIYLLYYHQEIDPHFEYGDYYFYYYYYYRRADMFIACTLCLCHLYNSLVSYWHWYSRHVCRLVSDDAMVS
jgi:hypothetical protein